jgi:hypothetical protein
VKSPVRPARFYVGLAHSFVHMCLHKKGKAKTVEKVSGGQIAWPAGHVARPTDHHLASLDPYKYPSTSGNQNLQHILEITLARLPFLVY